MQYKLSKLNSLVLHSEIQEVESEDNNKALKKLNYFFKNKILEINIKK